MHEVDYLYDHTEETSTRFVCFAGKALRRFDLAITTTNRFYGKNWSRIYRQAAQLLLDRMIWRKRAIWNMPISWKKRRPKSCGSSLGR